MLDWKSLHQTIDGAERILLSTHENPDGDGLGSAAAVYHYLNSQGKNCKIINISDLPLEYEFLNQNKKRISLIKRYIILYFIANSFDYLLRLFF